MTPRFREATEADVQAIVALLAADELGAVREAPGDPAYMAAFREMAADPNQTQYVAEERGRVVACLQLTVTAGLGRRGAKRATLESVQVAVDVRGAGIGRALVRFAVERARERGCALVQLTSDLSRTRAHAFYERLGFTSTHAGFKLAI